MIKSLNKKLMNKQKKSGFTLIELIIVIAIIAILAMIALPRLVAVKENANVKADIANAKEVSTAVVAQINDDKITTWTDGTYYELSSNDQIVKMVNDYMSEGTVLKGKSKKVKNQDFAFKISSTGDVSVYIKAASGNNYVEAYPSSDLTSDSNSNNNSEN